MKKKVLLGFISVSSLLGFSQQTDSLKEKEIQNFVATLDFRPRAEYRNGYRQLGNDTTNPSFFVSQRTRINLTYSRNNFIFHTSLQDVRIWGQTGQFSTGSN